MVRRILVTKAAVLLAVAATLGVTPAIPAAAAGTTETAGVRLYVKDAGAGLLLTSRGATARLGVAARAGGRAVPVPGTLRFSSSAPAVISVSGGGLVTALADPGSAVITVTSTAPGTAPVAVTVAAVQLTPGTVSLTAAEVTSITPGRIALVRDRATLALRNGTVAVDAAAGLVASLSDVARGEHSVTARTTRVPLTEAFRALRVGLSASAPAATVAISGRQATVRDAAGNVVARLSTVQFGCTRTAAGVTVTPPSATLAVTGKLVAQLSISPLGRVAITLEAGAAVSGRVSLGALRVAAAASFRATCSLTHLPGISIPLPAGLPPIGSVAVTVTPSFTGTLSATTAGAATLTAPVVTGTWSALAGIGYSHSRGWSRVYTQNSPAPRVTGPELAAPASVSASLRLAARLDLGLSVSSAGITLAGIDLAWSQLAGTLRASLAQPYSDLDLGYTGPRYAVGTELSAGLEVSPQDSALSTLLSWLGLTPPVYTLTLFDRTFPLFSQPVPTIRSADATLSAGLTTDTLTCAAGAAWNGATVRFLLFPAGAAPGQPTGTQVATATVTGGIATARWQPAPGTASGSYVFVAELDPAGFLPFPSLPSAPVTITGA
jgi:hypothetical protein